MKLLWNLLWFMVSVGIAFASILIFPNENVELSFQEAIVLSFAAVGVVEVFVMSFRLRASRKKYSALDKTYDDLKDLYDGKCTAFIKRGTANDLVLIELDGVKGDLSAAEDRLTFYGKEIRLGNRVKIMTNNRTAKVFSIKQDNGILYQLSKGGRWYTKDEIRAID